MHNYSLWFPRCRKSSVTDTPDDSGAQADLPTSLWRLTFLLDGVRGALPTTSKWQWVKVLFLK